MSAVVRRGGIALAVYARLLALTWFGFKTVPSGFIPTQDSGYLIVSRPRHGSSGAVLPFHCRFVFKSKHDD